MSQYQHYIPQLLLRNFSHSYKPPKQQDDEKRSKSRPTKGKYKGDKVLHVVDLSSDEPQLLEPPVSRWFGLNNMYNDTADVIRKNQDIEKKLAKLECHTAEILQKIRKAHESGEQGIWLTRVERNKLRKFLFIMSYRGPGFYRKYLDQDPQEYNAVDKNLLWRYMDEKKFSKPRDVWLHGLRAILDLDIDPKEEWMMTLPDQMFPGDAQLFIFHIQCLYMAICSPANQSDEFVLSDRCYNVFEGPTHETYDARTNEYLGETHTTYHMFAPVSPWLMIVLRSVILPEALEDADPKVQKDRQMFYNLCATQLPNQEWTNSILEDLPVKKATNSYSEIANGRIVLAPGKSGIPSSKDKFCFAFWSISTRHLDTINSIFLDNLLRCKSIAFRSIPAFRRTLEAYMTSSEHGFKTTGIGEHGALTSRLACLQKLSVVLKMLGSELTPIWKNGETIGNDSVFETVDDIWLKMMKQIWRCRVDLSPESQASQFWKAYCVLGGSGMTFIYDLEQSWLWYKYEKQVRDVLQHFNDRHRGIVLGHFYDLLVQQYPRHVWLFVKHRRWMLSKEYAMLQEIYMGPAIIYAAKLKALFQTELEDDFVIGKDTRRIVGVRIQI